MSSVVPKRLEEVSSMKSDENFKTPLKSSFFPKRISELSPLESSDDEDSNLPNKDILNASFMGTPSTTADDDVENDKNAINDNVEATQSQQIKNESEIKLNKNPETKTNTGKSRDSISRQLNFKNASSNVAPEKERSTISMFSKIQTSSTIKSSISPNSTTKSRLPTLTKPLKSLDDQFMDGVDQLDKSLTKSTDSATTRNANSFDDKDDKIREVSRNELCTPKITSRSDESNDRSTVEMFKVDTITKSMSQVDIKDETPYKAFQMPSARRLPSSHRLLSSNTSKKYRSNMEEEFRSQKVLFTTPSAVSRPAIQIMNNLGLDDSLNCYKSSPMTTCLSPVNEERKVRYVHQMKATTATDTTTDTAEAKPISTASEVDARPKTDHLTSGTDEQSGETKKILRINGKDFVIQKKIGQGGSSSVFLAEHKESKLECAVKVVDLRGDPALIEGYVKEVKILAMLQDKVNVIRLYEYAVVSSESTLYMVMEKGDSDLRKVLQTYKTPLPLYTLVNLWHQMLQSVNYIHKNDVIHSDLKPENFLLVRGRLKLIDFGISSKMAVDATSIIKYSQVGTFNYISPEALMDTSTGNSPITRKNQPKIKISTKSDVWSLGCILYLLLYKKTPFAHIKNVYAKMQAIINPDKQIEFPNLPNYYPAMLVEMAQQCLKHNPKERASVADLLNYPFHMLIPINN